MRQCAGAGHGGIHFLSRLVRHAKRPDRQCFMRHDGHASVGPAVFEDQRVMLFGVVQADATLQVGPRLREFTHVKTRYADQLAGLQQQRRLLPGLGDFLVLACDANSHVERPAGQVEDPQAPQNVGQLGRFLDLQTELVGAGVGALHVGRCVALGRHQRHADGHAHGQLLLHPRHAGGQAFDQRQPARQRGDRLQVGRALNGALPGFLPVSNGLGQHASLGAMMRHQCRLGLAHRRELCLQCEGNFLVVNMPTALEQRLVGGVQDQGVLEQINASMGTCLSSHF